MKMVLPIVNLSKTGLQTRAALDERVVEEYAEAMREGATFPPVDVYLDTDGVYYLADGFHRVEAALRCGKDEIEVELCNGGYIDALRWALSANAGHGLRRTNADKRRALEMAWENRLSLFGGEPSNAMLAEACGVSQRMVAAFRSEAPQPMQFAQVDLPAMPRRVGKDGKTRSVPTRAKVEIVTPTDRFNKEIPPRLTEAFKEDKLSPLMVHISAARTGLKDGIGEGAAQFAHKMLQDALINLDNAYRTINNAKPYCVCRMCQGEGCMACGERGWQTASEYDRNPKEFKAL